jgi:hypothetical protein
MYRISATYVLVSNAPLTWCLVVASHCARESLGKARAAGVGFLYEDVKGTVKEHDDKVGAHAFASASTKILSFGLRA